MDLIRMPIAKQDLQQVTVGIPRSLLYYRYGTLWTTYFQELGIKTIVSENTNLDIIRRGTDRAASEMCLEMKIYMGHVDALVGKCTYILVPRISDFGIRRVMCTNFQALPDLVSNIFRDDHVKILTYDIDSSKGSNEKHAMIEMASSVGVSLHRANKAYKVARKAQNEADLKMAKANEQLYCRDGLKLVVAAHSYILEDEYFGKPILRYLEENGVSVIRADLVDRKQALKRSAEVSPTLKWEFSREIVGSLAIHRDKVDGAILLSVYPCALDSMVNEMLIQKNRMSHVPILQMTLDTQTGMAGLETRLESFIDILKMRREAEDLNGRSKEA